MRNDSTGRMTVERFAGEWLRNVSRAGGWDPLRSGWWAAYASLLIASLVLLQRWWDGLLDRAPSTPVLLCVTSCVIVWCAGLRRIYRPAIGSADEEWVLGVPLSLSCLVVLLSLTNPLAPLASLILIWSVIVAVETCWWTIFLLDRGRERGKAVAAGIELPVGRFQERLTQLPDTDDEEGGSLPVGVTQKWTRQTIEDGREAIYGSLRVAFAPTERTQVVHVTFCPAFAQLPELCLEQSAGPSATIDIAQLAPYGARLEVRLEEPSASENNVVVEFEAFSGN